MTTKKGINEGLVVSKKIAQDGKICTSGRIIPSTEGLKLSTKQVIITPQEKRPPPPPPISAKKK